MRRAETVLALQQCCGCVVRRFTSDIGGGVVSEEACKWKCGKGAFILDLGEEATERKRRYIGAVNGKSVKVFTIGGSTALSRSEEVANHIRTYNNEERCTAFGKGVVLGREAADLRQRWRWRGARPTARGLIPLPCQKPCSAPRCCRYGCGWRLPRS